MKLEDYLIWCFSTPKTRVRRSKWVVWVALGLFVAVMTLFGCFKAYAEDFTDSQIADAIYKAEGGSKTSHPYGILQHYKVTTPRQACLNTIAHARRDFKGGDFITFLGGRYCPIGASNDPTGLNRNWIGNVKSILERGC
jgi:hypothetical protein